MHRLVASIPQEIVLLLIVSHSSQDLLAWARCRAHQVPRSVQSAALPDVDRRQGDEQPAGAQRCRPGRPGDEYWFRSSTTRLAPDGSFHVEIDDLARAEGHYRIFFCFDNGVISGDGKQPECYFAIVKSYRLRDGQYRFGD
jgi:hypothetical protein